MNLSPRLLLLGLLLATAPQPQAQAVEYPIGEPVTQAGMHIAAVYLQPVEMDPPGMMLSRDQSDIHIEADIKGLPDNPNGFVADAWVPYLDISYTITKASGGEARSGTMMPMVASDGPHYGDNVKLFGIGQYKLTITVKPPASSHGSHFGRHTDRETGVAPWFQPLTTEFEFTYAGTGKAGGY